MESVIYRDLGCVEYASGLSVQREAFDALMQAKTEGGQAPQWLLVCEHPHVYTMGRSAKEGNLLVDGGFLDRIGATLHRTDRGGDVTYHGPGQIVLYPILDLQRLGLGLKDYIAALEEAVIGTLADLGLKAGRVPGATGVWLAGPDRKICAIGVRSSRWITMHGLALNVNTDLEYFRWINPCGFTDRGVTSLERETGERQDMAEVKALLVKNLENSMNIKIEHHGDCKKVGAQASG